MILPAAKRESLPELFARRMADLDLGTVRKMYGRLPKDGGRISYETVRKLANGSQRTSKDPRVPRDLSVILDIDENEVRAAMRIEPTYGPWELPPRAQNLDPQDRQLVMALIDGLLRARKSATRLRDSDEQGSRDSASAPYDLGITRGRGPS